MLLSYLNILNGCANSLYFRLYSRYIKFSYFAANAALNFWRELLKNNINSQVVINRGNEISKLHTTIKDIAHEIMRISPNDIKFLISYAAFLWQIVHIEQEA